MLFARNFYGGDVVEYQGSVARVSQDTAIYRHTNDTDTLYAVVLTTGAYDATGSVTGDHSAEPGKYVFAGLADDTAYEVRIRAGASPAVSDLAIAGIPVPVSGGGSLIGPGSVLVPITITVDGQLTGGVEVWVSTDIKGENVIAGTLVTSSTGELTPGFMLDPGTYYCWKERAGINFNNPELLEVE